MANHKFSRNFHARKSLARKTARAAYCTGCGGMFEKHHLLMNHRATFKCGGRFLSEEQRELVNQRRLNREHAARMERLGIDV